MRIAQTVAATSLVALAVVQTTSAQATFLGPTPYTSQADSPLNLSQLGYTSVLEDFEDGTLDLPGVSISAGAVKAPSATTDSVDGDDGAIDGFGTAGHTWAVKGASTTITFDPVAIGELPRKVGFVFTDGGADGGVLVVAFGPLGEPLGSQFYDVGDMLDDGATAEDRFIGVSFAAGISSITITNEGGELEIDHLQFELPFASQVAFHPARPYASIADSPILKRGGTIGVDGFLVDFEGGAPALYGATLDISYLVAPGPFTDSVDGDDGTIDGSGSGGNSAAELAGQPITIEFDAAKLGGLPKAFAFVVTDVATGERHVRIDVYNAQQAQIGTWTYVVIGDDSGSGTTAEDRLLELESIAGIQRIEITCLDSNIEIDHVQYDLPSPPVEASVVNGRAPYLSIADSGFNITEPGVDYVVIDFEQEPVDPFGADLTLSYIVPPSPFTDSVDADDGAIDGSGTAGTSGAEARGVPIVLEFHADVIGALPRDFGIVVTDVAEGPAIVRVRTFDAQDELSFIHYFTVVGDASAQGTTAEDRFLGLHADAGVKRVEVVCLTSNFEIDHIQYSITVPSPLVFIEPAPYLSLADSPFGVQDPGVDYVVLDFERGVTTPFGASLVLSDVLPPGPETDSVDGDDGVIDGSGTAGTSGVQFAGSSIELVFDAEALGALPTKFGIVVTDIAEGPHDVVIAAFGEDDSPLGEHTFSIVGDAVTNGTTAEDRFIGFTSTVGIGRVTVTAADADMEVDHIQFDRAVPPPVESPADLNGDGMVDGADLGLLLGAWGGTGPADLNQDGVVDGADLGLLLGAWT